MLTNTKIHEIYQEMQQRNSILPNTYPGYYINLNDKHEIELSGQFGRLFSIPTPQLSDIHAILQLCHPDTPYYVYRHIYLSEKLPGICLYNYKHAPNILTTQIPPNKKNNTYIIQPTSISHTIIEPNEPIIDAIERIHPQIEQSLTFVHQYPHIDVDSQRLDGQQKIPHLNNMDINITAYRVHPSNIEITFTLSNESGWTSIDNFIISTQDLPKLADRYVTHMQHIAPKLIQDIQDNFTGSQHEKIHIIRQAIPYLTHTNNDLFTCIQDCAHILMNHYACPHDISHHATIST